jgi:hypothetical protein
MKGKQSMTVASDTRQHPRYKTSEQAELSSGELPAPCSAAVLDISLGGCRLRCKNPFLAGKILTICLMGNLTATVNCEVRYSVPENGEYTMGVRFCPDSHAERISLAKVVYDINQRYWAW